ncbi:MAG: MerR family transcriptional regulator [Lachnospiraceae bacterium]|nr:MerR family transcriptional regulator [Lachnospiraceae bacterium]
MSEKRYIISDASKQVDVEAHVLRYWEEELTLEIPRNEMGHRYYTEENIKLLKNIKVLKDQGFQLKAIKMVLPELITTGESNLDYMLGLKEELNNKVLEEEAKAGEEINQEKKDMPAERPIKVAHMTVAAPAAISEDKHITTPAPVSEDKLQQFQIIMTNIVSRALVENNPQLGQEISEKVSDNVLKEMDYLMRMQDEKEEQRFKKLDETIRVYQKGRQEAAASAEKPKKEKKKRRLFRKKTKG